MELHHLSAHWRVIASISYFQPAPQRNGTYERRRPAGARIARWYCPKGQRSFSLLPDCLPSRLTGTMVEVEQAVVEREATGVEAAAEKVRPGDMDDAVTLDSAMRWVRRRVKLVHASLCILVGLLPGFFAGFEPTVTEFRSHLGVELVLPHLRGMVAAHLRFLPPPLGFGPRPKPRQNKSRRYQHQKGPDPPLVSR